MSTTIITKVIMDSGKHYEFDEHPEDFLKRFYDEETGEIKQGFIHGEDFSINVKHISSIENVEKKINEGIGFLK